MKTEKNWYVIKSNSNRLLTETPYEKEEAQKIADNVGGEIVEGKYQIVIKIPYGNFITREEAEEASKKFSKINTLGNVGDVLTTPPDLKKIDDSMLTPGNIF